MAFATLVGGMSNCEIGICVLRENVNKVVVWIRREIIEFIIFMVVFVSF